MIERTSTWAGLGLPLLLLAVPATSAIAQTLPPVPVPAANPITPEKAVLGKALFWEEQLSSNGRMACGTCHLPEEGYSDPRQPRHPGPDGIMFTGDDIRGTGGVPAADIGHHLMDDPSFGFEDQVTARAALFNGSPWAPSLFWDGRATGRFADPLNGQVVIPVGGALESQSVGPILNSVEMAHEGRTWADVATKLAQVEPMVLATNVPADVQAALASNPTYGDLFTAAFGDAAITPVRIAFALATYQRTLIPNQTPLDLFLAGNPGALTGAARRGWDAFRNPGTQCSQCHVPGVFSDNSFRALGLRPVSEDAGRGAVTGNPQDNGMFRVPSLRNVALKSRFMHNGSLTSLAAVVNFYGTGGGNFAPRDPRLRNIRIPGQVRIDLVAFLTSGLTDPRVANQSFPFDRPTLWSERNVKSTNQYGGFTSGAAGVPRMIADAPAAHGTTDWHIGVANVPAGTNVWLGIGFAPAAPGVTLGGTVSNLDLANTSAFVPLTAATGSATFAAAIPNLPGFTLTFFTQWFAADPTGPQGFTSSRGAQIDIF